MPTCRQTAFTIGQFQSSSFPDEEAEGRRGGGRSRKRKLLQVSMDAATDLSHLAELMDFSVGNVFTFLPTNFARVMLNGLRIAASRGGGRGQVQLMSSLTPTAAAKLIIPGRLEPAITFQALLLLSKRFL